MEYWRLKGHKSTTNCDRYTGYMVEYKKVLRRIPCEEWPTPQKHAAVLLHAVWPQKLQDLVRANMDSGYDPNTDAFATWRRDAYRDVSCMKRLIKEACVFLDLEARQGRYAEKWTPQLKSSVSTFTPTTTGAATGAAAGAASGAASPSPKIRNPSIECGDGFIDQVGRLRVFCVHKAIFNLHES